jgi:hypothetical protein
VTYFTVKFINFVYIPPCNENNLFVMMCLSLFIEILCVKMYKSPMKINILVVIDKNN